MISYRLGHLHTRVEWGKCNSRRECEKVCLGPFTLPTPYISNTIHCHGLKLLLMGEAVSVVSTFDDLGLKEDLLRGIYAYSAHPFTLDSYLVL